MPRYLAKGAWRLASDQPAALTVSSRWDGRVATIAVRGEIDLGTVGVLSGCLDDLARQNPERLVIDLADVGFIDSSGLHALVRVRKALPAHCPVVVRSPQRRAREIFELTGLSSLFIFE
jgi:anti-anti-sigma factor